MKFRLDFSSLLFVFIPILSFSNLQGQDREIIPAQESAANTWNLDDSASVLMRPEGGYLALKADDENSSKSSSATAEKKRQKAQKYKYWYLLPLGIPQFAEGFRGGGAALALGQISMLALYYDRQQKIVAGNKATAEVTRNIQPAQAATNPFITSFLNQNEKDVKEAQKEARFSMLAFLGLYGFSVYEAIYDPFGTRKLASLRRQKKQMDHPRERNQDRDSEKNDDFDLKDEKEADPEAKLNLKPGINSRLGLMMLPDAADHKLKLALSWQLTLP